MLLKKACSNLKRSCRHYTGLYKVLPKQSVHRLYIARFVVLALRFFEDAAECQCARLTADTLKAANTSGVIRAFFRLYTIFAQLMASFTIGTLVRIESQEEGRYAIEKREYCTKRT